MTLDVTQEIPHLRLPDPALLLEGRARRLEALAASTGEPYLAFLGRIARGQREAIRTGAVPAVADRLLDPAALARDPAVHAALRPILAASRTIPLPAAAAAAVAGLADAGPDAIARLAAAVLSGDVAMEALASVPFVGAALQAVATVRAARLDPGSVPRTASGCPVCGSPPVAGIVQGDDRLRYLTCALCSAEWHLPRLHCATCRGNDALSYRHLESDEGARAETCERCRSYVKLFDLEKRHGAEPLADDAATLALDVLLGEEGYGRGGVNLLMGAMPAAIVGAG
ncbi:formate dehydrogenase accessory protein FdhE [Anaeromyxobacter oryzae]|uniref:Protein FdhE n=1 Tax=Anaeromyxobacter oryzae TaxID=2918170 RepID=A0ABN6MSF2_9BACT|nr:formate dehydrogenase accessory protein FdhE [Anaeromyxobacter oryzae]BDG02669.1 protein FdhE [Anaeromyxobacter oryzae]